MIFLQSRLTGNHQNEEYTEGRSWKEMFVLYRVCWLEFDDRMPSTYRGRIIKELGLRRTDLGRYFGD